MKKPEEKRTIQMEWTESDFKNRGQILFLNKALFPYGLVVMLACVIIAMVFDNKEVSFYCPAISNTVLGIFIAVLIIVGILAVRKGNQYWKENKDKQQPIKMESYNGWGRVRK